MAPSPRNMVEVLQRRAETRAQADIVSIHDGDQFIPWTWSALRNMAAGFAAGLRAWEIPHGTTVLLVLPAVEQAVPAVLGCWWAGRVPLQMGTPHRIGDAKRILDEARRLARCVDAAALVAPRWLAAGDRTCDPTVIAYDSLMAAASDPLPEPTPHPIAFLQLTSGSTGTARAAVIAHDRLMRHLHAIRSRLPASPADAGVTWLPLYHDMGFVGGLLYPLLCDFHVRMISPLLFRQKPLLWLKALSDVGATHTAAPPSGWAIAARLARRAVAERLDLRRLRCAMVGAEPIPARCLEETAAALAPCGFRSQAFFPVYGLAEATVAVSFPEVLSPTVVDHIDPATLYRDSVARPSAADDALAFVAVGSPLPGVEIRVADPQGRALGERAVGEIQVRTDSGMSGYNRDPAATAATRDAHGWLRTGDLGYVAGGQLFVTGRCKELIIRAGMNLIPSALEETAAQVDGVRDGAVVAVGLRDEARATERAVLVVETRRPTSEHQGLREALHQALVAAGLPIDAVYLVAPNTLPRTSSGKPRRLALAKAIACGELTL